MRVTALVVRLCIVASASVVVSKAQGQGQAGKRLDVKVGECSMRLMQSELDLLKPKGKGQLVWVGPCANGFIHGFGVLLMERTEASGLTYRNAGAYNSSDGQLGRPHYPAYIAGAGTFRRDDGQRKDPVEIQRSEIPAWAGFIAGKGDPSASEKQAVHDHLKKQVAATSASAVASVKKEVDVGNGCKGRMEAQSGTDYSWIGPCKDGWMEGLGYWIVESNSARSISRHTMKQGYMLKEGPGYSHSNGMHRRRTPASKTWEPTTTGGMPAWAREFLTEDKRPQPATQPAEVAAAAPQKSQAERVARVAKNVWVDVGGGCKSMWDYEPIPGEKFRWVGPCKDGLTEGLGYLMVEDHEGKKIWRQTNSEGRLQEAGTGYAYNGSAAWRARPRENWERITTGDLPNYARAFLMEDKLPPRLKQPEEVPGAALATSSGDCNVELTPEQKQFFTPKGDELLVWVGPCANGLAHGRGVVFQRRKDPQNGVTYRYAVRYFAREGSLQSSFRPVYIGEANGVVWIDAEGAKETARVKRAEVPAWASYVHGKGNLTSKEVEAAREVLAQELRERAPKPDELVEAGDCKLAFKASPQTREYRWRGPCDASGFAHGPGYLEMYRHNGGRAINKVSVVMGRMLQGTEPYEINPQRQIMHLSGGKWYPIVTDQAPAWAREFLLGATFAAAPVQSAPAPVQTAQAQATTEAEAREREEIRQQIERRRREDEEDDRRARREAEEEREARNRQWTDMATTIIGGAAAMKRQQDEQNARRETERRRIEADNARYRQQRADEDRRWLEQNQRQQQAALERQRADQERQRVQQARLEEERRRPRKERVNLPKHSGCIRLEWDRDKPQENSRWYTLQNGCAQTLTVHWCDRPGCQRSTMAATIPGGGSNRGWVLKKNGLAISVMAACQMDNGGGEVYYNNTENQCWTWVTMN